MPFQRPVRRPFRTVVIPGGDNVHVRGLTIAELKRIDARVADPTDPVAEQPEQIRSTLLMAGAALAEPDGTPTFPFLDGTELDAVAETFTPDQLAAVCEAAVGRDKDAAKN
ncbi:MAG TPA: hypothetical protein VH092_00335 [Urbifossiella sp.]|jgi:hypothetical protein|nr:hypothetical protein [Urbifossiella sp.]